MDKECLDNLPACGGSGEALGEDPMENALARCLSSCFFFQAEDGIRDLIVTGVQTCALPIYSVRLALEAAPHGVPIALVHDAVRPFVTRSLVDAVLAAARADGAAICALPVAETVKRVRDGLVEATVERAGLWAVQTPQAFRTEILREAHDKARRDGVAGTDDAMLVERLGHGVRVVPRLPGNLKITTPDDLRRAPRARPTPPKPRLPRSA